MESKRRIRSLFLFVFRQRDGRVHLRRNGPRLSGGAGRGLPIANRWILVRHDRIRPRLLQEFQVPADVQQTSPRLQGQRYLYSHHFDPKSSSCVTKDIHNSPRLKKKLSQSWHFRCRKKKKRNLEKNIFFPRPYIFNFERNWKYNLRIFFLDEKEISHDDPIRFSSPRPFSTKQVEILYFFFFFHPFLRPFFIHAFVKKGKCITKIAGDLERLRRYWMTGTCKPGKEVQKSSDPLALEQFLSAFLLLMMGILLAAAFLLLEHLYFKYVRQHLARSDGGGCCALFSLVSRFRIPISKYIYISILFNIDSILNLLLF